MKRSFKRKYLYIFISVILSLLLHLIMLSLMMKVAVFPNFMKPPAEYNRKIKIVTIPVTEKKKTPKPAHTSILPDNPSDIVDNMPSTLPETSGKPGNEKKYDIPAPENSPISNESPTLPSIVSVDADKLSPDRKEFTRNLIPKLPRMIGGDYTFSPAGEGGVNSEPVKMHVSLPPLKQPPTTLPTTPVTRMLPDEKVVSMDPLIDVKLYKYPLPTGGGFFRIDLSPNKKAVTLKNFNKDVIILMDVSGSIGRRRLAEFKDGVLNALPALKPKDRINIVAFKSKNYPMSKELLPATASTLKKAERFIYTLDYGGTTNIYSALQPFVGAKNRVAERPLIIFLLSDGQVNAGDVIGSRDLINTISNQNSNGAAIYTYSCGEDRNSFLMDILSYRNRGESLNVPEIRGSNRALTNFIDAVSDVKVSDLEYQISSDLADATFPKRLPNLYKNKILSIYGRYGREDDQIGLRITGKDSSGVRREIVVGDTIADAEKVDYRLAQEWAKQYIYHLYSLLSVKYSERIKNEIHDVAARYRLKLPYLDKHLVPRKRNFVK